ncbi:MAG: hypothetical protein KC435_00605 [Thermomicrobiales bacterium]|nr:hypothetical protein [Thermomicrobiales bacterium]
MNTTSRRVIVRGMSAAAAASILASTSKVFAAQANDREYVSELTNSVVELTNDDFTFAEDSFDVRSFDEYTQEYLSISTGRSTVEIMFVQNGNEPADFVDVIRQRYQENYDTFEDGDSDEVDGSIWFTAATLFNDQQINIYGEYQTGAYDSADLLVLVNAWSDEIVDEIEAAQNGILVGDAPPLLMLAGDDPADLVFPVLGSTSTTSTGTRSTRSSRTSSTDDDDNTSETRNSTRGNDDTKTTSTDADSTDYREAVTAHREEFLDSFAVFATSLAAMTAEDATDADLTDAVTTIDGLAADWITYPDTYAELTAPSSERTLKKLYKTWCDEIATLGESWNNARNSTASVEVMFNQIDVVDQADKALAAELGMARGDFRRSRQLASRSRQIRLI